MIGKERFNKYLSKQITTLILSLVLIIGISIGLSLISNDKVFAKDIKINRISGQDRFDTCVKISQNGWSESYYAVLTNGNMYADAVVSSPLAYKFEAPILLVNKDSIPTNIVTELQRLKTKKVFIIGGTSVISKNVEDQLSSLGISIEERIAGNDRFETALKVKHHLISVDSKNVYVVDSNDWQGAIETSPIACATQCPIIYGNKNGVSDEVKQNVNSEFHNFQIIGEENNKDYVDNTKNWLSNGLQIFTLGQNKTDTNLQIYETFKDKFKLNKIFLVSSKGFADGLCVSNIAGANNSLILFVDENNISTIESFICQHRSEIDEIDAIGGENNIQQQWLDKMQEYVWGYYPPDTTSDKNKPLVVQADPSKMTPAVQQMLKDEEKLKEYAEYLQKYGISKDKALQLVQEKTGDKNLDILVEGFFDEFKTDTGKDITKRRFYVTYTPGKIGALDYLIDKEDGTIYKEIEGQKNVYTLLK
jgi:putative cell wall-binding protein